MKKLYWRIFAIIIFLVWCMVLITNNYQEVLKNSSPVEVLKVNIIYGIPAILFAILMFYPRKFIIYAFVCAFLGLENIVEGAGTNGILMYLLGCGFFYRIGFLFKNKAIIVVFCLLPLIAFATQLRLGTVVVLSSFLDIVFVCAFFVLGFAILKETILQNINLKADSSSQEKRNLSVLTSEELVIVLAVLENKTFASIGNEIHKSESAVKQYMVGIYKKLDIESKKELLDLQKNDLLNFPE